MSSLKLDPSDYPAGIAIWGGVDPIIMTNLRANEEAGIHVHARKRKLAKKDIDESFETVLFKRGASDDGIKIDQDAAVAFMISQILQVPMAEIPCSQCNCPVFEGPQAAAEPKTKHQCASCGHVTSSDDPVVANPLIGLRQTYSSNFDPAIERPVRRLEVSWKETPGGLDIWGSNQAIIWTANRSEEEGLHIHLYDADGVLFQDDTYSSVRINGIELDVEAARLWMAQREVAHLKSYVHQVRCDSCDVDLCDKGDDARIPSLAHWCGHCSKKTMTTAPVIANPTPKAVESVLESWKIFESSAI